MRLRKKKSLLDQASDIVKDVRPQVESAVATARDAVGDFVENTALPALADAREKAGPALAEARDRAAPYVAEARDRAATALADARDSAGPALADARKKAAPYVSEARDRASAAMAEARDNATPLLETVKNASPKKQPKKRGRLRKVALFAAIAGAVGFAARKLQGRKESDNWQSSYVPTPAPAAPSAPTPSHRAPETTSDSTASTGSTDSTDAIDAMDTADDSGGAGPDEAIADAAEEPQPVTTPDEPATVTDLDNQ